MEIDMTRRTLMFAAAFLLAAFGGGYLGNSADAADDAVLIKALGGTKVSLQQGLTASQQEGQPISGKYEMEDGKLQLSIYTAKGGKYFEVTVDFTTGKVAKSEPITEGDDLTHAKSQSAAMAKVKAQLKDAVDKATRAESGSRAVSVTPEVKGGHSVASIVLLKGTQLQTVTRQLN
jgi:hypothetical protein